MNLKHNYWFWKNVIPGRLCDDIIQYGLRNKKERAITSMPLHYSYGLSVFNSHLLVGATILLTKYSVVSYHT